MLRHRSLILAAAATVLLVALFTPLEASKPPPKLGGWTDATAEDMAEEGFQKSLAAATAAYNTKFAAGENGAAAAAGAFGVSHAQKQLVAGVNYKFTASMAGCADCSGRRCKFIVWYRSWMDEPPTVMKMKCGSSP